MSIISATGYVICDGCGGEEFETELDEFVGELFGWGDGLLPEGWTQEAGTSNDYCHFCPECSTTTEDD